MFATKALCYKHAQVATLYLTQVGRMNGDGSTEKSDHPKLEAVEIICPKCRYTEIIYLPVADLPLCPECNTQMMISELLDEGKSY